MMHYVSLSLSDATSITDELTIEPYDVKWDALLLHHDERLFIPIEADGYQHYISGTYISADSGIYSYWWSSKPLSQMREYPCLD